MPHSILPFVYLYLLSQTFQNNSPQTQHSAVSGQFLSTKRKIFPLPSRSRARVPSSRSELSLQPKDLPRTGQQVQVHHGRSLRQEAARCQSSVVFTVSAVTVTDLLLLACLAPAPQPELLPLAGVVAVSTPHVPGRQKHLCRTTRPTDLHKPGRKEGEWGSKTATEASTS